MNFSNKPTILLIEDVTGDIDILDHILKAEYMLHVAKTGEAGLKMAIATPPDLILLDIVLPDRTGFAVLEELKRSKETEDIPVIIITGVNNVQYEEKGLELGAVDYITKPFHNAVVAARIRTHIKILQYVRTVERFEWTDVLTGLPNRDRFEKLLEREWDRSVRERTSLGILLIDLDRFKDYNDTHGIRRGDLVLQRVSEVASGILQGSDDSVFRYHGDGFTVLLPNAGREETAALAEKIRSGIETMNLDDRDPSLGTVSVVIVAATVTPEEAKSPKDLMLEIENLLRRSQASERNRVYRLD